MLWRFCCALRRGAHFPAQTQCGVDQAYVTIGLRKISQHAAAQRIKLFSEQPHVVAAREQTVE